MRPYQRGSVGVDQGVVFGLGDRVEDGFGGIFGGASGAAGAGTVASWNQ